MEKIKNLFIIDDDELFAFVTKKHIENTHLVDHVEIFKNGKVALDFFKEYPGIIPEIMLVDISMPVMGGIEFLENFEKLKPSFKNKVDIYIVTSEDRFKEVKKEKSMNHVKDYLTKAFDSLNIIDVIKKSRLNLFR